MGNVNFRAEIIAIIQRMLGNILPSDEQDLRNSLSGELKQDFEISTLIPRLPTENCVYLYGVCKLEKMRLIHSKDPESINSLFRYLESRYTFILKT